MPQPGPPLLPFSSPCLPGVLLGRSKRFFIHCLVNGRETLAHTNNSGSMLGLIRPGCPILLTEAPGKKRKLPYTLEMILPDPSAASFPFKAAPGPACSPSAHDFLPGLWVGVNTLTPNRLLRAAFTAGRLPWAAGYTNIRPEATRSDSRLDALLTGPGLPPLWVECKNVTLVEDETAAFPDAVSIRGQKHLRALTDIVRSGERAALLFCVQRPDARCFGPADYIDPVYADLLDEALRAGVEAHPHQTLARPDGIDLGPELPLAPRP